MERKSGRSFILIFVALFCFLANSPAALAGNEGKVALVMKALSNPFFSSMEAGARKYAQQWGIALEVFGVERETDVGHQIGIVENLISRGYGAIVIAPADSRRLLPACKKAVGNGIVVINIDNPFDQKTMAEMGISIPFVGPDNRVGARMVGEYIKRKLKGQGRVLVIEGIRGAENAELRKAGFVEAVTANSRVTVAASESANWHTDEAFSLSSNLLRAHAPIDAVFCANDKMALGVLQALDLLDLKNRVLVGGYDNIDAVRNEMQNGRIHATVEQHPDLMGQYGVELASKALKGQKIPQQVPTPLDLITHDTFNKTIALSISNLNNPFFSSLLKGAQGAASLFGVKLIVKDAQDKDARQLAEILALLKQEVSLLIINPTNTETISSGIETANSKKIPVITVDRKSSGGKVICHIESDNVEGGRMVARLLAGRLKGKGQVVEIEGIPGTSAAYERGGGFNKALQGFPQLRVVAREVAHFERKGACDAMQRLLQRGVQFDAVFAHNDNMILGVLDQLEKAGYPNSPVLIGFDAIDEAVKAVQQGRLTATVAQRPETMGRLAVRNAVSFLRGEGIQPKILVDLEVIER